MKVLLTYFKPNGKYYSTGEYYHQDGTEATVPRLTPLYEVWERVRAMRNSQVLPGLMEGHSDFAVLVDVPDHPHNHPLLLPAAQTAGQLLAQIRAEGGKGHRVHELADRLAEEMGL